MAATPNNITYDYYYNESWQVLEVQKAGRTNKTYQQSVWGIQYVDAPVAQFRDTADDGTLDETLYYTYDGNFNVTAVIKPDGTVAERYTYDPYGQVTFKAADWSDAASQAKSAYDNEILYCGYRFDPESGNHLARRRYLTPPLGRWMTTDLIVYGDGMNLYEYVSGSPSDLLDPEGLAFVDWGKRGTDDIYKVGGRGGRCDIWEQISISPITDGRIDPYELGCAKCWVVEGTGLYTVYAEYMGVVQGGQGTPMMRIDRIGKQNVTVTVYRYYITTAAAAAIDRHEELHIATARKIYDTTIALAERAVEDHRIITPLEHGNSVAECRSALVQMIQWGDRVKSFWIQENAANLSGGTIDQADRSLQNYGTISWGSGATRTEATEYLDVPGRNH